MSKQNFQNLQDLPIPLPNSQCVLHKHEILICGGSGERVCYSYHTLKNKYKLICLYPNIMLYGHCVVKLVDNNKKSNEITLLSFGGFPRHILAMKYVSVWSNECKLNNPSYNQWITFTDNHNNPIHIGRNEDSYEGVRAVIGGSNNHLLFITYRLQNISVFDLNTFKFIKHDTIPTRDSIIIAFKKKTKDEMILFCKETGLSIAYNEHNNIFQFHKLPICDDITLREYAYVCINGSILFFGGFTKYIVSNILYKYSIQEKIWTKFRHTLPIPLFNSFGILNEDNTHIHIIGGLNSKMISSRMHIKTKTSKWMDKKMQQLTKNEIQVVIHHWIRISKIKLGWINDFNKIIIKYVSSFQLLMVLQAHDSTVNSVTFSADGRKIVSASYNHTVRMWDFVSGRQVQTFRGHTDR
ncbi:WD repeat-containing protein, partial [Reticulomyxa filosa]